MDFLYELIFLGLIDATQTNKIPKSIRVLIAIAVSLVFVVALVSLVLLITVIPDQSIGKRVIYAIIASIIALYYLHLFNVMRK